MSKLPVVTELPIDSRTGMFSLPWRQWLQTIDRALGDAGTDTAALAAQVAAIATALGSPDGTVANIPDQDTLDVVIYGRNGVTVTGKAGMTPVYVELEQPEDTGVGALLAITRDEYGRVSGSKAATMTGTANRITVTNGDAVAGLPTFDIAATYVGQTSLTTLGTISTGTWNGSAIAAPYGGTGQTGYAVGDLLYASSTTALSKLAAGTNTYVLTMVAGVPAWAAASGGGGSGGMTLVGTATVAGSAATSLTLSGLDLSTDQCYYVLWALRNATSSATNLSCYYNGDTTAANYWTQYAYAVNATANSPSRVNTAVIDAIPAGANKTSTGDVMIMQDIDGRARSQFRFSREANSSIQVIGGSHIWLTLSNVTSISVVSSVASALAVGSYIKVFKVN